MGYLYQFFYAEAAKYIKTYNIHTESVIIRKCETTGTFRECTQIKKSDAMIET